MLTSDTKALHKALLPNKALGKLVKQKRQELGMSMRDFAAEAGIPDYGLIGRIEKGLDVRYSAVRRILMAIDRLSDRPPV